MAAIITGNPSFPTQSQVPTNSILDINGKQTYLGNEFISTAGVVALTGTTEVPLMYVLNPATNDKSIFKSLRSFNIADASGAVGVFRLYSHSTGVSGGSAVTPVNCRLANTNTSTATVLKSPTVVSNGTLVSVIVVGFNAQNIDSVLYVLDPGQSLLVTVQPTSACSVTADLTWYEI